VTSREIGDERQRYSRRSLLDRLIEIVDWLKAHPAATVVLALFLGVVAIQVVAPARSALPGNLRVGDCLYVRTPSSMDMGPGARPIGDASTVAGVLMGGGAEQAGCDASHGHEVSAIIDLAAVVGDPGDPVGHACATAFGAYVGYALDGSIYETFAARPTQAQQAAGLSVGVCLVARRDGQWMMSPARGSGQ
jgi:hypothetical protein